MKKTSMAMLISLLSVTGVAFAQSQAPSTEIRESTDPAKVADVEQRAADIQARQQASASSQDMSSGSSESTTTKSRSGHSGKGHGKMHSRSQSRGGSNTGNSSGAGAEVSGSK
ncbi:hypothetical protein ACFQUU_24940 [Herbaspirillum sp. GCM10030257]|uniref:hypothetical protein n=1 Tax=Herbaspirillum sp. GCM10030257 TaxID=3273393 RepID=UPI0036076C8F